MGRPGWFTNCHRSVPEAAGTLSAQGGSDALDRGIPEETPMKRLLAMSALALACVPVLAADVGVSIGIQQPGLYGRIDIGRVPTPPVLVYEQPVVIVPGPVAVQRRPIYLHVPPGHARDWRRYCGRYQACGQPVYFVQDRWYRDVYAPRHHDRRGPPRHWDDRRGDRHDDHPGRGHDRGHDKKHHGRD